MTVSSACGSDDWGHSLLEKDFIPQECDTFIYDQFLPSGCSGVSKTRIMYMSQHS